MSRGREMAAALLLLVLGGGLALLAAGRPWWHGVVPGKLGGFSFSTSASGNAITGHAVGVGEALPLGCLAAAGAVLAVRGRARTAVGVLTVVVSGALLGAAVHGLARRGGYRGVAGGLPHGGVHLTAWPILTVVGAVVALGGGLLVLLRGDRWPALGARYDAPAAEPTVAEVVGPRTAWDALDRGEDPT